MAKIVRFGVSMDAELLGAFDDLLASSGYANRSEAFRDLVRDALVQDDWDDGQDPVVGLLAFVHGPAPAALAEEMGRIQRQEADSIKTTLRVPLGSNRHLEVLILRGIPSRLRALADRVLGLRGVKHGRLAMITAGRELP